jgi:diguanylate cyclase
LLPARAFHGPRGMDGLPHGSIGDRRGHSCVATIGGKWSGESDVSTKPANESKPRTSDIVMTIAAAMREMGVSGLPRNYEIFYEVFTGSNRELQADFFALGNRATQDQLDELARRYFAQSNGFSIVESARIQIEQKLDEIKTILQRERSSLEKYGHILDRTTDGLSRRSMLTKEFLEKILSITAAATVSTREQGQKTAASIADKSAELEKVKSKLEEYKRLADTDPLTQVSNRRGFDKALARIYSNKKSIMFAGLILADIDRFKDINDRYGHPVGDRIIQLIAQIFAAHLQDGMFLSRTGGEEFAVVVEGLREDSVVKFAEDIRSAIERTTFAHRESGSHYGTVTISMGVCMASEADGPDDLYSKADMAMYASKMNGRNRVTLYSKRLTRRGKDWMLYKNE